MTAAQTAHHTKHNVGWRKAVRYALTENPVVAATLQLTAAEHRRRTRLPDREGDQRSLFGLKEPTAALAVGRGIWDDA
jgi:hypothetical protein